MVVQLKRLLDVVLPPACAVCGAWSPRWPDGRARRLCISCEGRLKPPAHPSCARCQAPVHTSGRGASPPTCANCVHWPEVLRSARWVATQEGVTRDLIHALKYGGWPELADEMSALMRPQVDALHLHGAAPLVPIPTTPARLRARGYNQAERLATALAHRCGRPVLHLLRRTGEGPSQVALPRDARLANVEGAFSVLPVAAPPEASLGAIAPVVILVDDVLTTGSTAGEAARVLESEGVAAVHLITFARALSDGGDSVTGILPPDTFQPSPSS